MKYIYLILAFPLALVSCEKKLEKEDVNLPEFEEKLVLFARFTVDQEIIVNVSKNQGIFDPLQNNKIEDATVLLYEIDEFGDSLLLSILDPMLWDTGSYISTGFFAEADKDYYLEVSAPPDLELEEVSAQDRIPLLTTINVDSSFQRKLKIDPKASPGELFHRFELQLKMDIANPDAPEVEAQPYHLEVTAILHPIESIIGQDTIWDYNAPESVNVNLYPISAETIGPLDERVGNGILYKGSTFDHRDKYDFQCDFFYPDGYKLDYIYIQCSTTSDYYYDYFSTLNHQLFAANDPFSQPVLLKSNVENGYGCFVGYHTEQLFLNFTH